MLIVYMSNYYQLKTFLLPDNYGINITQNG
jgi:hypothetical protein